MPIPFSRTTRSLRADRFRASLLALLAALLFAGLWAAWLMFARIAIYKTTDQARLEVKEAMHPLMAPLAGQVVASHLELGRTVAAGELLLELDADRDLLARQEADTRLAALVPRIAALGHEIEAEEEALDERQASAQAASDEGQARRREAEAAARQATDEVERIAQLRARKAASEAELVRASTEARRRQESAAASELALTRQALSERSARSERRAHLTRLRDEQASVSGQIATQRATIARLEHEIALRQVRAPVGGVLGDVALLHAGSFVREGDRLASIVPKGELRIVAAFAPVDALGHLRPGQPARLRLHGFSWVQYGTLPARVTRVGDEVRDGRVRVELAVAPPANTTIPLQHGLPGQLEVEVERVPPLLLILRAAGRVVESGPPK